MKVLFATKPRGKVAHLILANHQSALCGTYISWPQGWPTIQPMDKRVCSRCRTVLAGVRRRRKNEQPEDS